MNAGYDIQSFESTGDNRYIEVKSAVANKVRFYWSVAERKKACELGASYWIYFVPRSQDLNIYPSDIVMIRDPINELGRSLEESPTEFAVNIVEGVDVSKRFDVIWKKRASL